MIVGVGGQGSLLASKLLGHVLVEAGFDAKVSEVHGMSQRGGSVVTYVKYGDKVYSPIIDLGEADYLIAFEQMEAARWLPCLRQGGKLILNTQQVYPMPVITGAAKYPADIPGALAKQAGVLALDALTLAQEAGSPKAVNIVLMGVLSAIMDIPEEKWQEALAAVVPERFLALNKKAFALGREYAAK
jgi:indolepyruvate ferredoxin oxidoreductase beta subunit